MAAEDRVRKASRDPDPSRAAHTILQIEREATASLRRLETRYRVSKPRIGITRALQREWQELSRGVRGHLDQHPRHS